MTVSISSSVLLAYLQARDGIGSSTASSTAAATLAASAPVAPWTTATSTSTATATTSVSTTANTLMESILGGAAVVNPNAAKLSVTPTSTSAATDYQNLFALYQGLTSLQTLATAAGASTVNSSQLSLLQSAFSSGLGQVRSFISSDAFKEFQVSNGTVTTQEESSTGAQQESDTYTTAPLVENSPNSVVSAFQGDVAFSLTATNLQKKSTTVQFDLDDMGSTPRTLSNVITYMNAQLKAAGLVTRVSDSLIAGTDPVTTTASNGVTTTTAGTPNQYALQIDGTPNEQLSFSATATTPSVYIAQTSFDPAATSTTSSTTTTTTTTSTSLQALLSSTTSSTTSTATTTTSQLIKLDTPSGTSGATTRGFSGSLPAGATITSTATAPDGSVYVLANVDSTINGQPIQGQQDVALLKYDDAGNLVYTRTLGSAATASGDALAVSADGSQIAVAGSITGAALDPTDTSQDNATTQQSFVTVFDSTGDELWSQNQDATDDNQVNAVAFGANNSVYVVGQTQARLPDATAAGAQDGYIQGFNASAKTNSITHETTWTATSAFTTEFGTSGVDRATGVAVDGSSVYVSSVENGDAVVRRYDLNSSGKGAPTLGALQDLGALSGGNVSGLAIASDGSVLVAGSTHNAALNAGQVTAAYNGNGDAFVADLSPDLQGTTGDTLAYYNAGGPTTATALTVSGNQAYITGQIAGATTLTSALGYAAAITPSTGTVGWATTFSGNNGSAAPAAIAVSNTGASVLDKLGLPQGPLLQQQTPSQLVTANSSARAGDKFYVQNGAGLPDAVTIEADDTYSTLAEKIEQASGYSATATTLTINGQQGIKIAPSTPSSQVRLEAGPSGQDALAALGLSEGLLTTAANTTATTTPTSPNAVATNMKSHYSITVPADLSLASTTDIATTQQALSVAIAEVQSIYADMTTAKTTTVGSTNTSVPAYITAQISNYTLALQRLSGSSSSGGSTGSVALSILGG